MRSEYLTHIFEAMNALISANNMPGIQDTGNNVYIVNKLQNNAFTWGMTTDYKMRHMIEKDPEDKKLKLKDVDNQDNYGFDSSTKIDSVWTITDKAGLSEALEKIYENLGNEVDDNFIYETLTGEKMYTLDQIEFSDKVKKITPLEDMIKGMCESIRNYTLYGKEKAELLAEVKYGDKSVSDIINEYKDTLLEESVNFRRAEQDDDSVLQEKEDLSRTGKENISGFLKGRVSIDHDKKVFEIKGINFTKFLLRLKEMYQYKGILNLFEKKYSWWSEHLYEKNKITKKEMKIVNLTVDLFFALELYKVFLDLADFYDLSFYKHIAKAIYKKTWISNYEKKGYCKYTDTKNLSRFTYDLKDYQVEFIRNYSFLKSKYDLVGYILSFEQGLGKTLTAVGLAECLDKDQIVIVCPNTLRENWALEITNYYKKYHGDKELSAKDIYVYNSKAFSIATNPKFIIVNQESIAKIFDIVKPRKNSMIIVDECHNFRSITALRVTNLWRLKEILNCKDNLMMSGTPIKATAEEIIPILKMIDPYLTDELAKSYEKSFKSNSLQISEVIKERFGRVMYRKTKDEVLALPNKKINNLILEVKDPEPYTIYYIRERVQEEYNKEFEARYPQFKALGERYKELVLQYSSAPKKLTKSYLEYIEKFADPFIQNGSQSEENLTAEEIIYKNFLNQYVLPNVKEDSIKKEIMELKSKYVYFKNSILSTVLGRVYPPTRTACYKDIFSTNKDIIIKMINDNLKKTVIFTPFLEVAKYIHEELDKSKIGNILIIGGTKNRMDEITKFKESDDIDALVATIQTLSTGVTLTEADQMFFFGTPYRNADFQQACDRIHRIGQTRDVNIYIVKLKSNKKNITNRIDEILKWSYTMSSALLESGIIESEDMSTIDNNHTRGEQYKYKAIDLYNDECYNYFDKKEIDYYRNGNRQGEILVETDYKSAIGYIYVREIKEGNLAGNAVGPFKVFPDYRGKGYGEILLRDIIDKYKANILGVYADNQVAIALYKKVGFKITKEMTDKKGEKFYIMKI